MRKRLAWMVGCSGWLLASLCAAQTTPAGQAPIAIQNFPTVSPIFGLLARQVGKHGADAPVLANKQPVRLDGTGASLRFSRPLTAVQRETLRNLGVELGSSVTTPQGPIYAAWVPFASIPQLTTVVSMVRAEPSWSIAVAPLESTTATIGAEALRRVGPQAPLLGDGVMAHIDSGIDVQHPHLFRADGGYFEWIDLNRNRRFDVGEDAIDFNRDGLANMNETAKVLDAAVLRTFDGEVDGADDLLDPTGDWLYLDLNGDGERNFGVAAGFTEEDPGYGEPVFVVDDADLNGELDRGERVVLLKTSKILQIVDAEGQYRRGVNLIEAIDSESEIFGFHGTGVASVALGGQVGFHNRVGVAPGTELLVYSIGAGFNSAFFDSAAQIEYLAQIQADEHSPLLVLHEWTNPFTSPQDGSTNIEAAIDALRQQGIHQVTPTGNLAASDKHLQTTIEPAQVAELGFEVGPGLVDEGEVQPFESVYVSVFWRGAAPQFRLRSPSGASVAITPNQGPQILGETQVDGALDTTPAGTQHLLLVISQSSGLPEGEWALEASGVTATTALTGRITDALSGWARGVHWTSNTQAAGSAAMPSTAASAFAVGGVVGRPSDGQMVGDFRAMSGQGPRMDGAPLVDIAAPDNPLVALSATPELQAAGIGTSWFTAFGGTSGAAPHVSAALMLLHQAHPDEDADALEQRLRDSALPVQNAPNERVGAGMVNVDAAVLGMDIGPTDNVPPRAQLSVTFLDGQFVLDASQTTDAGGDALVFSFDADYDGQAEALWVSESTFAVDAGGPWSRVWVRDAAGNISGAVAPWPVEVMEPQPDADMGTGQAPSTGCDACSVAPTIPGRLPLWLVLVSLLGLVIRKKR